MAKNAQLHKANKSKKDEFLTQITDIEAEMEHYEKHFKDKVVFCNCDDPSISNFFHYFACNFKRLGLKKLITTCYQNPNADRFSKHNTNKAVYLEYKGNKKGDKIPDLKEIDVKPLKGAGDFRSDECIELLKQADIVITNPPFSLFRDYVAQLIEHDKNFIILGSQNAITYKETFQLIKENKIWLGIKNGGTKWFEVPDDYEIKTKSREKIVDGKKFQSKGDVVWYTNLNHKKRQSELDLYKNYSSEEYPKYNNFDIINVNLVTDIPEDYEGIMGVPITFLDKYNPAQFEILGIANNARWIGHECITIIGDKKIYNRLLIKNKKVKV